MNGGQVVVAPKGKKFPKPGSGLAGLIVIVEAWAEPARPARSVTAPSRAAPILHPL